jgi:integrase
MAGPVGRRRQHDLDLPPSMYRKRCRYYYGREGRALGGDFAAALRMYAEIHTATPAIGTFSDAARAYRADHEHGLASKAPKTQREYERQLILLERVFGIQPLADITPGDVQDFLDERPKHAGTREKALLSAVFNHARTRSKLTTAPNPCAGVKGAKSRRRRYVTDAELSAVLGHCDRALAAFLELAWRTGADASVVLGWRRSDIQDGLLLVQRSKTGEKTRVVLEGPLKVLVDQLLAGTIGNVRLIRDAGSTNLQAMRKRFWAARVKAGADWQIRDLRAKAASDSDDTEAANRLLGHAHMSTTDVYRRKAVGATAKSITKEIKG